MPKVRTGRPRVARPVLKLAEGQKPAKLDYQRWQGRVVSIINSVGSRLKHLFRQSPSEAKVLSVFDALSRSASEQYLDTYHRSLHNYHIACALQLHSVGQLGEKRANGQKKLVLGGGRKAVDHDTLENVKKTIDQSTVALAYQFLAENRHLPVGFLKRALIPHFIEIMMNEYGFSYPEAKEKVNRVILKYELTSDDKVDFERILHIKNELRYQFSPSPEPVSSKSQVNTKERLPLPADLSKPALTAPTLSRPRRTPFRLDEEDKEHIKNVVDKGHWIKVERHDLRNRVKRHLLRNKRIIAVSSMGAAVSVIFSALTTGGVGAVVTLFHYVAFTLLWSGGGEAWGIIRAMSALQKMEASSDFKLENNELGVLSELDEEKFRKFMRSLQYICSQETLTRIFNYYSELEKDAETYLASKPSAYDLDSLIKNEESKARYHYRRDNLAQAFHFFDRLYGVASRDLRRMKQEWNIHGQELWNAKFKDMSPRERLALFNRAANDKNVASQFYHYPTNKIDWLENVFPDLVHQSEWSKYKRKQARLKLGKIIDEELPDPEQENLKTNNRNDKVAGAFFLVKSSVKEYIFRWLRGGVNSTITHGFKIGWHGIKEVPKWEVAPQLPKLSLDGLATFGFFFLTDLLLDRLNTGINKQRLQEIKDGKKGATFSLGSLKHPLKKRKRTGREEINTLRKLTKDRLPDFIDRIFNLHEAHRNMINEIRDYKKLDDISPTGKPFQHLSDYDAAVMLLKWQYMEQMVQEMMIGAIGQLHSRIQEKVSTFDHRIADKILKEESPGQDTPFHPRG